MTEAPTVLVTGASRGIGRAVAVKFATDGARVVVNHPPGEFDGAEETGRLVEAAGGTYVPAEADIADPDAVDSMLSQVHQRWGALDVVVNNAGICPFADFFDIDVELWDRVHQVNLRGAFLVTQGATRRMVEAGRGGNVVLISSISAWTGGAQQVHYCATKAGLSSLAKSLAIALGPHRIRCNAVLPGLIATDMNRDDLETPGKLDYFRSRIPSGEVGTPDDVAGVVWQLTRPESSYINGADVLVDGGMFVNLQ